MRIKLLLLTLMTLFVLSSCNNKKDVTSGDDFSFFSEKFADLNILRYQVPGFDELTPQQQELIYYLSEATKCGRDILYDQNGKYNLAVRRTLENIYQTYNGEKSGEDWENFVVYLKRIWFSNGIYHHYASDKIMPEFSKEYFNTLVENSDQTLFPVKEGETVADLVKTLEPVMFDPNYLPKGVNLQEGVDIVQTSAVNFYEGVTQKEVEEFYDNMKQPNPERPLSLGLNSKVYKENGVIKEEVYKLGGKYSEAIEKIIYWLEKAITVAENEQQKAGFEKLIEYYKTGCLQTWDDYNVIWVQDLASTVDYINGFIETYGDPFSRKATWEAIVNFKNIEATKRTKIISENAQWFEDNSPIDPRFKKETVKGVSAKVITVAQLGGDCHPSTPIGINLPNADWIRRDYGSKSVTIENITYAYDRAAEGNGFLEEFTHEQDVIDRTKQYGSLAGDVHTDLHECLGHGSGQLLPGTSSEALKNYSSALEETRADLFALYYIMDDKVVELGIIPNKEAAKAEYDSYIRNGLMTQLTRIQPGKDIEQAHMRNRQTIANWSYENGKADNVIEKYIVDGKTYIKINDYDKLRELFGKLLAEVQRIKSEGDYEAGKNLVETYGIKVDQELHKEVLERYAKLNIAPYSGFINPEIQMIEENGTKKVTISYPDDFATQMLNYSNNYSFLPTW
ncbi:MAG: dipeptidyl-peptidase 3 family protein [Bacteroidales bacterium]|jgi:dipeptidyl-peptidase-3